mmetsp:Transcript_19941/g.23119  ORF Transcript_19941/g.23119 Transcript_19941/m.23119 type:complete len:251 (-) Transcript_19941:7-759(-)
MLFVFFDAEIVHLEVKVEGADRDRRRLVRLAVQVADELVFEGLFDGDPLVGAVLEHLAEQVYRRRVVIQKQVFEVALVLAVHLLENLGHPAVVERLEERGLGLTEAVDDELELVLGVVAGQEGPPQQQLREYAADGPHVHGRSVVLGAAQQFGGPVPPRRDVVRHGARLRDLGDLGPRQSEVADFEVAVAVHEQVARLEIAVEDARRVHVFHASQDLVDEELDVVHAQLVVRLDNGSEVGLHDFEDGVNI